MPEASSAASVVMVVEINDLPYEEKWHGIYVNGELGWEGMQPDAADAFDALGITVDQYSASLDGRDFFPRLLKDMPS